MIDPDVHEFFCYLDTIDPGWRTQPGDEGEPVVAAHTISDIRFPIQGTAWARCSCGTTIRRRRRPDARNRALESGWAKHTGRGTFESLIV
jgi:hypothetical protein